MNNDSTLQLGTFEFNKFSIPEFMRFGGPEHIEVHRQPGGARTIDILGRDDSPYAWAGIFLQADAHQRALDLEAMKVAGAIYPLVYGRYNQPVIISKLDFVYHRTNWIEYAIECTPVYNADVTTEAGGLQRLQNRLLNAGGGQPAGGGG